jgi:site-specific recombinase XerD
LWLKSKKDQSIAMNMKAQIVNHEPLLFEKFADQHINDELKKIMAILKFQKKVTFHVARHTFATSFLRAGEVEKLKDYWDIPYQTNDDLCTYRSG